MANPLIYGKNWDARERLVNYKRSRTSQQGCLIYILISNMMHQTKEAIVAYFSTEVPCGMASTFTAIQDHCAFHEYQKVRKPHVPSELSVCSLKV